MKPSLVLSFMLLGGAALADVDEPRHLVPVGASVSVGGGLQTFSGAALRDHSGTAATWSVRGVLGTRTFVGMELAYLGSVQSIELTENMADATLWSNAVEGNLRLNLHTGALQPFVFAGTALRRYTLDGRAAQRPGSIRSDGLLELTFGCGGEYRYRGLLMEVRFTYRGAVDEDLVPNMTSAATGLDTKGVAVALGWEL